MTGLLEMIFLTSFKQRLMIKSIMDKKSAITIFADIGNAPWAWRKDAADTTTYVGGNMADAHGWYSDYSISPDLEKAFIQWAKFFDSQPWYRNDEVSRNFDWQKFHTEGIALVRRLKQEIGEQAVIYYVKPSEDDEARDERFEILISGELRSFIPTEVVPE